MALTGAPSPPSKLVVITGGEPFRQNISPFIQILLYFGMDVQVETNGTIYRPVPAKTVVVCSPKTYRVAEEFKSPFIVKAFKYVVAAGQVCKMDGLPEYILGKRCRVYRPDLFVFSRDRIYVQPQDDKDEVKNKANIQQAVDSCLKFGYRLCLQTHKIAGLE